MAGRGHGSARVALPSVLVNLRMPTTRLHTIKHQPCNVPCCPRAGRGRFCAHHRALYRAYGAPVAGPSKQFLAVHQRYLQKTLGPLQEGDAEVREMITRIGEIALEPRAVHFPGSRLGRVRQASYEATVGQVLRLRQGHIGETDEELAARLWWAFLTVQAMEMASLYVHRDRHHFWTSVLRLVITDTHRQKPSSRYVDYLSERLNKTLALATRRWIGMVDL